MRDLLILVDFQNDYLRDKNTQPHPDNLIYTAARALSTCRGANVEIIHVRTSVARDTDLRMPHWKAHDKWRCVLGSYGHEPPTSLKEKEKELVIHKSGFDPFEDGQLRSLLNSKEYHRAFICGLHLHACVREVISGVFSAGLEVCVIEDATGSNDPVHAAISRRYFEERTVRFIKEADLEAYIGSDYTEKSNTDVSEVLDQVGSGFLEWSQSNVEARCRIIRRIANELTNSSEQLAQTITAEIGKPISFSRMEISRTAEMMHDILQVFENHSKKKDNEGYTVSYQPLGPIVIITPFNNPIYIALGKIIPAILYGNTVVWKPSPKASVVSEKMLEIIYECGINGEIVQLVQGGSEVVSELLKNPVIQGATITGSLEAGYGVQELCAKRHIPFQGELGGNNAAIIWEDADVADAARKVCEGAFQMAGQRCTANRRAIVHEKIAEEFVSEVKEVLKTMNQWDPHDESTTVGPVVSSCDQLRILRLIDRAKKYCDNHQWTLAEDQMPANWVQPTLLLCSDPATEIFQEETFGPILVMIVVNEWAEAMNACNGVKQGLAASVFTKSEDVKKRFLNEAKAGILKINSSTSDAKLGAPFGGWKASGIGPPEHGRFDREFYTRVQTVYQ